MMAILTKRKGKKYLIKHATKFEDFKKCKNNEIILKLQHRFRSEAHNVFTKKVNKIALSTNYDKTQQWLDGVTLYPYDSAVGRVCRATLI